MMFPTLSVSRWFRSLSRAPRRRLRSSTGPRACDALEVRVVPALGYVLTTNNLLATFDTTNPAAQTAVPITGTGGETLVGIDIRPRDGKLYGISDAGKIYTLNTTTGAATLVSSGVVTGFPSATNVFGTDFNPVPDRLRVTSGLDANLRINVDTAATITDGTLAYAAGDTNFGANPMIAGSAYVNNYFDATTTTLYGIDTDLDVLVRQNPPNNGTLNTVGPLGVDTSFLVGFDVQEGSNTAFAVLNVAGVSGLYTINLQTGAATLVVADTTGTSVRGFAITAETKINRMYRSYNPTFDDHFYTTSEAEFLNARNKFSYKDEASAQSGFAIANGQVTGSVPVYRLYSGVTGIHYYTLNKVERDALIAARTYTDEGILGYMFASSAAATAAGQTTTEVFHLYNTVTGGHLFTSNSAEVTGILAAFPTVWQQHASLGFGFAVGTQYTAPAASSPATAAPAESSESTTAPSAGPSAADAGLVASASGSTTTTSAPASAAAESDEASAPIAAAAAAETDAVFSTELGDLLETL